MSDPDPDQNVERERVRNSRRDVVAAGLLDEQNRILMVRTTRLPGRWQPVGGGMEPDDSDPTKALVREITEELGIELPADSLRPVVDVPYDFGEGTIHFFRASLHAGSAALKPTQSEILEHRWVDLTDAMRLPVFPATAVFLKVLAESIC